MRRLIAMGLLIAAGCGSATVDPCSGEKVACLTLEVKGPFRIDELAITLSGNGSTMERTTPTSSGHAESLPVLVALRFAADQSFQAQITAEGRLSGGAVGSGTTTAAVTSGARTRATVTLSAEIPDLQAPSDDLAVAEDLSAESPVDLASEDLAYQDLTTVDLLLPDLVCAGCADGSICCSGSCVVPDTTDNCGACGVKCDTTSGHSSAATCMVSGGGAATCKYTCTAPFANCNASTAPDVDGCEVNTNTDKLNCGACFNACNTTNNSGTSCSAGTCTFSSCNPNQADCSVGANHNADECETVANNTTHCGTCAACFAPSSFVTGSACNTPGGNTLNFCSYSCACVITNNTARTCDGTQCSYTCKAGFSDCQADTVSHTPDGCECPAATTAVEGVVGGCCASTADKCQAVHDTGLATEHFYDCTPRGSVTDPLGSMEAMAACKRHNGGSAASCVFLNCTVGSAPPKQTGDAVICDNSGTAPCNCWDYALVGTFPGGPATAQGFVNTACQCASTADAKWR